MIKITGKRILILLISIFLVWNAAWFLITTIQYSSFTENIPKNKWGLYFIEKEDGYTYSVAKPSYPTFTGNLGVVNYETGEALIIWPSIFGEYKYGFRLQRDGLAYEIYVNENMEPIDKNDILASQKVKECQTELDALFSKANETWKLK